MTDFADPKSTATARTPHLEQTASKSRAHGFFWSVLTAAAAVSITGNATQALLHETALPVVAAAVAVIPPLALLAAVHGVTVLARAHTAIHATRWVATAMTVLIAVGAFWLSFTALRALAITAGVPRAEAWLWPVIIEGSMAQATVALLALAHSAHTEHRAHAPAPTKPVASPMDHESTSPKASGAHAQSAADPVHTPIPTGRTPTRAPGRTDRDFSAEAARLCARDPGRRRDPDLVTRALAHHHLDGWSPSRIATELNKSRSTISRILSDAADLHAHDPRRPERSATVADTAVELESETPVGTN